MGKQDPRSSRAHAGLGPREGFSECGLLLQPTSLLGLGHGIQEPGAGCCLSSLQHCACAPQTDGSPHFASRAVSTEAFLRGAATSLWSILGCYHFVAFYFTTHYFRGKTSDFQIRMRIWSWPLPEQNKTVCSVEQCQMCPQIGINSRCLCPEDRA